ncbi:hypothetical protein GCM10017635_02740 [Paracoccus kondratievae]|uniref:Uncharacterized protein n=1 Tax=Paracoccus kondratievae TaxID=135740 RepID=A0AAD3RSI5_9RHOB|nr:hypothetical protein GCM10017635_02740 [Paracoccus kondratievae]
MRLQASEADVRFGWAESPVLLNPLNTAPDMLLDWQEHGPRNSPTPGCVRFRFGKRKPVCGGAGYGKKMGGGRNHETTATDA